MTTSSIDFSGAARGPEKEKQKWERYTGTQGKRTEIQYPEAL